MRQTTRLLGILGALALSTSAAAGQTPTPQGVEELHWLAGCWVAENPDRIVEEQWMAPRGQLMAGTSRTVVSSRAREYEFLLIRGGSDGLVLEASPSGQRSAEFRAVEIGQGSVSFANPAHDFPQRIEYRLSAGGDSLLARVGAKTASGERWLEFPYARAECG